MLPLSAFSMESPGIGDSGPISISGQKTPTGFLNLNIKAFGREFVLNERQLVRLEHVSVNGIQLSYEAGYKELGGRTLYIVFIKGFTSGARSTQTIELRESGDVKVAEPRPK